MPYSQTNSGFYCRLNIENPCRARQPLTETQFMSYTIWTIDCLNEISVSSLFFVSSSLFLLNIFSKINNHFPFCKFVFSCCFNNAKSREYSKSAHTLISIYLNNTSVMWLSYMVELHCLYKNRSPDDAIVILMIPCFFLKLFLWFIRLIDLQL